MFIVPRDMDTGGEPGDIRWQEKFEVKSLEVFTASQNERQAKYGYHFGVISPDCVAETKQGKTLRTYHVCAEKGCLLLYPQYKNPPSH